MRTTISTRLTSGRHHRRHRTPARPDPKDPSSNMASRPSSPPLRLVLSSIPLPIPSSPTPSRMVSPTPRSTADPSLSNTIPSNTANPIRSSTASPTPIQVRRSQHQLHEMVETGQGVTPLLRGIGAHRNNAFLRPSVHMAVRARSQRQNHPERLGSSLVQSQSHVSYERGQS